MYFILLQVGSPKPSACLLLLLLLCQILKWCELLFGLQLSHYCVPSLALLQLSPASPLVALVRPLAARHSAHKFRGCNSEAHFTLSPSPFKPNIFFLFAGVTDPTQDSLSISLLECSGIFFEAPLNLSVVRTFSCTPHPLWLSIFAHPTEQFSLSCHRPSYLNQQPGSLLAYLPHFKGKQASRFKKWAFSGRISSPAPQLPPYPGLSSNAACLLNVCFPCLMMPVCISQPLNPR